VRTMLVERLTADDRIVLWTDSVWAQDVGVIAVLEGGPLLDEDGALRLDEVRTAFACRLDVLPRLRQVLLTPRRTLGWPLWVDDPSFDVRNHVREAEVPAPGGDTEFLAVVEGIRRQRLDVSRPLWEVWLLPGLAEGRVGLFLRIHHVVADGIAGLATLSALLDPRAEQVGEDDRPSVVRPRPSSWQLLLDNWRRGANAFVHAASAVLRPAMSLRSVRAAWPATRELLTGKPGPSTSLDGVIGQGRALAVVRSSLAEVSSVARAHGATVNDVLLAMMAGGLRALLLSRGEPVNGVELPVYVPMSLRRGGAEGASGNDISQIIVTLPLGPSDPVERLKQIASAMAERKAVARPSLGTTFRSRVLSKYLLKLIIRQRINVSSADLIGPTQRLRLAGAEVQEMVPLINLMGNVTLGMGALSYAGRFDTLAVADAALYPDLDLFAAAAGAELHALLGTRPAASGVR